jgi:hypothetical protein
MLEQIIILFIFGFTVVGVCFQHFSPNTYFFYFFFNFKLYFLRFLHFDTKLYFHHSLISSLKEKRGLLEHNKKKQEVSCLLGQ